MAATPPHSALRAATCRATAFISDPVCAAGRAVPSCWGTRTLFQLCTGCHRGISTCISLCAAGNSAASPSHYKLCTRPMVVMILCLQLAEAQKLLQHQQAQLKSLHSQVGRRAEQQLKAETAASAARQDLQVCSLCCGQMLCCSTCGGWRPCSCTDTQHVSTCSNKSVHCTWRAPATQAPIGMHCYGKSVWWNS